MAPESHPRRRGFKAAPRLSTKDVPLRKSGTFHSPNHLSSDVCDPLENSNFMPKRSQTNPTALEQLLVDAGEQRVASVLASVDRALAGNSSVTGDASILKDSSVLPVPEFLLGDSGSDRDEMQIDQKKSTVDHHETDSGLGSSISGSNSDASTRSSVHSALTSDSAITRSFSTVDSMNQNAHCLSEYAAKQIQKHIIKPILREEILKDFHPLVRDVPRRIGAKNISNLRDLEKTLLFLAPEFSVSISSYLRFCETSIRCLHTTVGHLSDQDQRLPTDRPYTNNYFIDLVEQIRRYAQLIAETRQKEAEGKKLDKMDYSPGEKITLKGGLSHNGTPAELVREKDGQTIPITVDGSSDSMATAGKRTLEADDFEDDDGVVRSMARRRKSERPGDVIHLCKDCKKEFKRPCDLTKHEKTHSRPWKCPDAKCKYHDYGWPTEKERERHVNDKHSAAPHQFKCLYKPCPYSSKRESNCKQHMEKAHGWEYVRSKNNGRKRPSESNTSLTTPQTPATPLMGTPASGFNSLSTPLTPFMPSPSVPLQQDFNGGPFTFTPARSHADFDECRRESVATSGSAMTFSSSHSALPQLDFTPDMIQFDQNVDFPLFDESTVQQPTPALSAGQDTFPELNHGPGDNMVLPEMPHLSPAGQPDAMLYSPHCMDIDEGFGDGFNPNTGDFQLYDNSTTGNNQETWYGSQFDTASYYPNNLDNDFDDFMGQCGSTGFPSQQS